MKTKFDNLSEQISEFKRNELHKFRGTFKALESKSKTELVETVLALTKILFDTENANNSKGNNHE